MLKVALVGLGTWAKICHLPVYQSPRLRKLVQVKALVSREKDRAEAWAEAWHVPHAYDDFDTMLERARPDVVAITTPDDQHTRFVLAALDHSCHVLVEKPLTTDLGECAQVLERANEKGRKVITLFHKRSDPLWMEARRRIRAGTYGEFVGGSLFMENPISIPYGDYFASDMTEHTDPNWFLGSHMYDLLRVLTGCDPVEVTASKDTMPDRPKASRIRGRILLSNGKEVTTLVSWTLPPDSPFIVRQGVELEFTNGSLTLDGTDRGFTETVENRKMLVNPYFLRETPAGLDGYGALFLADALRSIADPAEPTVTELPSLSDAWWATATACAVEDACRAGVAVRVRPPPVPRA